MKQLQITLRSCLALLLVASFAFAERPAHEKGKEERSLSKVAAYQPDIYQLLNINNLWSWHRRDGQANHSPTGDNGTFYPRGTAWSIYQDGMVFGSKAYLDAAKTQPAPYNHTIRVGGTSYATGQRQGWVNGFGANATFADPGDARARIYRVRRDWKEAFYNADGSFTLDAKRDAAESNETGVGSVTNAQVQQIIDRYLKDWNEWPVDLGAPYIERNGTPGYQPPPADFTAKSLIENNYDEPGIAGADPKSPADQVLWTVFNDLHEATSTGRFGSEPQGLEIQMTMWGYKRTDALGNIFFRKWRFINKGGVDIDGTEGSAVGAFHLDSMYVCQWSDPDLGNSGDDLTGCDTTLSMGFIYNGNAIDSDYRRFNLPPPSAGYDFLQGPLIKTGNADDRAVFDLKYVNGAKNLGMTGFSYFSAGSNYTDPVGGYLTNTILWYKMLRGYAPLEGPDARYNHPPDLVAGAFPLAGDPVKGTGHIDGLGTNYSFQAGDRRLLVITGPFSMAPGDTQEVVVALVNGIGSDRLSSVSVMKFNDRFAQNTYNALFQVPKPPAAPDVKFSELDGEIVLEWGSNLTRVSETEVPVNEPGSYKFEGYNIYQLPSPSANLSAGKRIITYDLPTDPAVVTGEDVDVSSGLVLVKPLHFGSNSNIKRYFKFERDYIKDRDKLNNGEEYYVAVTAYSVSTIADYIPAALESEVIVRTVVPKVPFGTKITAALGDTIKGVTHSSGASDGAVYPIVVHGNVLNGNQYKVTFTDNDDNGLTEWTLTNTTTGKVLLANQDNQSGDELYLFTEGFQPRVVGAPLNFKNFQTVANGAGPLDPPEGAAADFQNFPSLRPTANQQVGAGLWMIHTADNGSRGTYSAFLSRSTRDGDRWSSLIPHDFEMRFTATGSASIYPKEFSGAADHVLIQVPFELWRVGDSRVNDPSDDIRMIPYLLDENEDGVFGYTGVDQTASGGDNDPYTDWIYWIMPPNAAPGDAGYKAFEQAVTTNLTGYQSVYEVGDAAGAEVWARVVLFNWNGGSVSDPTFPANVNQALPETGTVFRIITTKPNTVTDSFTFSTVAPEKSLALAQASAKNVGVFPNPYFAFNPQETTRLSRFVTFNNLPETATIRIFNLAGQLVARLDKSDASQFIRWNLLNLSNLPVASGMYIAHVDMPALGATKVLKLAIIQEGEVLETF